MRLHPYAAGLDGRSAPLRRRATVLAAITAALLLVSGLAVSGQAHGTPRATPADGPRKPLVPSVSLLVKQEQTVAGQQLVYPDGDAQVSSSIITLVPGQRTGRHRHDAPLYVYVLSGAVTVTYEDGTVRVFRAGQALMEAVGTVHEGRNAGRVDCRLLVVNIGAEGVANTVVL